MPDATQAYSVRRFGSFEINLQSGELRRNGIRLRLSGQPSEVLAVLIQRPGELVTREELHSKLWPADTFVDFDHGLNNAVARIREVLNDSADAPRYVETLPRRGYRFIAPLTEVGSATVPRPVAELEARPLRQNTDPDASGHSVLPAEKRFPTKLLLVLLGGVVLLVLFSLVFVRRSGNVAKGIKQPVIKSLAVLPLKNMSRDPSQEYLVDGMTEELIGRLSGIHDLRVISRTSVMQFKDTRMSAPEIAEALHVDALVEGSVMREGSRIRVHAQLIRGATDEHFWSQTYERNLQDVLALQSDVAEAIAKKVEVTVTGKERARLVAARPVSPEAYESNLKGRFVLGYRANSRVDIEQSIRYFQDAIEKDPSFAQPYVGLGDAYNTLSSTMLGGNPPEMHTNAMRAAQKALELDPELVDAHMLLAEVRQKQYQWAEAEAEYQRAIELGPNNPEAHFSYALFLALQGRVDEAMAQVQRASKTQPTCK
jgi:TolB-like protein/DNA-binding winged helix-turn-helix (wHTH) protein